MYLFIMRNRKFYYFILVKCAIVVVITSKENEQYDWRNEEMRLFYYSSKHLAYQREDGLPTENSDSKTPPIFISPREINGVQALDYHPEKRTLFWTELQRENGKNQSKLYSVRWSHDISCDQDVRLYIKYCQYADDAYVPPDLKILRQEDWNPRSLAVDYIGNKLYIVDTDEMAVNVYDLNGNNKVTIFENASLMPFEVTVDPERGLMFVLVANKKSRLLQIYRMNMDGSEPQLIVDNADVLENFHRDLRIGFTLDTFKSKIYFGNFKEEKIETVNYLGKERLTVIKMKTPQSISIYIDTLYSARLQPAEPCKFLSCELNEFGVCIKKTNKTISCPKNVTVDGIKSIDSDFISSIKNPCRNDNGGCQHHCLLKSPSDTCQALNFSCVCNSGYQLESNSKNCTQIKASTTYIQASVSKEKNFTTVWNPTSSDIFPPFQFFTKNDTSVVAYDWVAKNFYYVKATENSEINNLMVSKCINLTQCLLKNTSYSDIKLTEIHSPILLEVHPYRGYLFAILSNGSILKLDSDGSNKRLLPSIKDAIALAIDYKDDKLYWINKNRRIFYSELNGRNCTQLVETDWNDLENEKVYMYIYDKYLYVKKEMLGQNDKIWQFHKLSSELVNTLEIDNKNFDHEIVGTKILLRDAQYIDKDHPCAINNGECQSFCFGVPEEKNHNLKRICACSEDTFQTYQTECDENPNKNLRLLFYSSKGLFFSKGYSHELYEKGNFNKSLRSISQGTRKDVKIVSIDYHPGKKMLYWTSPREGYWTRNPQLLSLKLNDNFFDAVRYTMRNTDIQILREDEYWNPRSLAVDYIGNKLYIADTSEKSIVVLNLDGTNKTTVFKGKSLIPFEVALDPPEGLMFILTANTEDGVSQIYRANMDGTEAELIVDNLHALRSFRVHEKTAFAIDTERKRILFGDLRNNNIESVNYSGEKCSNKSTIVGALHPHSLSVYKDFLYWSNDDPGILGCDESYSLKTCQLDKGSRIDIDYFCHSGYKKFQLGGISDFKSKVYAVKAINRYLHADIKVRNPCSRNNGGCNHHCLIKPSKNTKKSKLDTSCLCYQGYKLTDSKICEKDSEIYAYNQAYISASEEHQLLREDAVRLIYSSINMVYYKKPFRFFQVSEAGDNLLDVSIEPNDRYPYPLKDCSLKPNEKNFTLIHSKKKSIAKVITYDWITKNLYYIKLSGEKEKNDLMVLRYDNPTNSQRFRKQKMDSIELTKIYSPRFMVVHPYRSYLFVALDNNSTIRLNSDGSNGTILPNVNGAEMLAIDYDEDVLYWINIDYYATWASIFKDYVLWKANLDGSEPKRLLSLDWGILNVDNIFMYVSGDYIYLKSSIKPDGLAINKKTEEIIDDFKINIESLYQENVAVNVSIKSTEQRLNREKYHPCAINNGGCEKFCFSVPGKNELRQKKVCF